APFTVTLNTNEFGQGGEIEVTISSATENFVGFFLQARSVGGQDEPVGTFSGLTSKMKHVGCSETYPEGAVTHTGQYPNITEIEGDPGVTLTWTASNSAGNEDVTFYATVALDHDTYWVKLESELGTYNGFNVLSPTLCVLLFPISALLARFL
ncbi:Reeler domain-containing protein, partial [Salmonella sp. S146_54837]|uniref:Reeler domain-containing protein n=4 Tax=unclassified Salmonella TaxID=2614656 RepID=UPI00165A0BA5